MIYKCRDIFVNLDAIQAIGDIRYFTKGHINDDRYAFDIYLAGGNRLNVEIQDRNAIQLSEDRYALCTAWAKRHGQVL